MSGTASLLARERVVRICSVDFMSSNPALLFLAQLPPASDAFMLLKDSFTYGAFIYVLLLVYSVGFWTGMGFFCCWVTEIVFMQIKIITVKQR